jgi:hypothetical protein
MNLITKLTIATAGAAIALETSLAPAQAALLHFSHSFFSNCPECAQQFSFTLDSSVMDENPSPTDGFFPNAISNIELDGSPIAQSSTSVITRDYPGPSPYVGLGSGNFTQFSYSIVADTITQPPYGSFNFAYNITLYFQGNEFVNQLASEPSGYVFASSYSNAELGPGGLLHGNAPGSVEVTLQESPEPQEVPEPKATVSILAVGALGAGSRLIRNTMKRKVPMG